MRIPRVSSLCQLPLGNARWVALSVGVLLLSVFIALVASAFGLFGLAAADPGAGRQLTATVVAGRPCAGTSGMETVRFTMDGLEHEAKFDGCGHLRDEPVDISVGSGQGDLVVHAADAAAGQGRYGRHLDTVLLVLSGVAGAGYGLLVRRGPRGTPLPLLGHFDPAQVRARITPRRRG